ncbi:hypothetical protein OUZ56_032751 [Daphnia magna]|uniref:Uncharacterized protein n=1 Tax=Daphnia magna TaxID=35525 RepID=A0ABQ9ZXQ2_9CRUS|nr:hypothetical protein OUZ56_032751 [Daphnia magna]
MSTSRKTSKRVAEGTVWEANGKKNKGVMKLTIVIVFLIFFWSSNIYIRSIHGSNNTSHGSNAWKNPFDYIGNAVAYGYIIYKSDFFYIYSGTLPDGSMYTVEVDIDAVPPSHHDVPCQCVEEYAREIVAEQIRSRNDQQDVEGTEKLPSIPTEIIQKEPVVDPSNAMPETGHVSDQSTDEELWAGCRSQAKNSIDLVASTKLLEFIKDHWEEVSNKKMPRKTVFTTISAKLRSAGVNISQNPAKSWLYGRWNKLKESYITYRDSVSETGRGACKPPALYEELHELLGNRAIVTPKALSSSLPMGKRVRETGLSVQEAAQELAMIQQENAYLVADGMITAEEAASAEAAITKSDLLPQTKKKKLGSSAKLLTEVVSNLEDFKSLEMEAERAG